MTTDTYCRVESISKPVTAWGVMKLVESGKLDLDQPVASYLKNWSFPASPFSTDQITVRQLLSHSAGIQLGTIGVRYDPRGTVPTLEEALTKDALLFQEPGKDFSYSNTGFNVLELLIEEITGRDFATYMEEEILLPLGMEHASFNWRENFDPPIPNGYDLHGTPIRPYIYPDKAAGGLFARIADIATFVRAEMPDFSETGQQVLSGENIRMLYQPVVERPGVYTLAFDAYGLGHFIEYLPDGKKAISHGGQGSGWMTHFHAVPETGDAIIIFTNSQRSWPFFAYILNDWAAWNGFGSIGMGKIAFGNQIMWILISLLLFFALWQGWNIVAGVLNSSRKLAPFARPGILWRSVAMLLSLALLAVLLWAVNQKYLFIAAVFPVSAGWLGVALFLVAIVLLFNALLPKSAKNDLGTAGNG